MDENRNILMGMPPVAVGLIVRHGFDGFRYRLSATAPALLYLLHPCSRTHPTKIKKLTIKR